MAWAHTDVMLVLLHSKILQIQEKKEKKEKKRKGKKKEKKREKLHTRQTFKGAVKKDFDA